MPESAINVWQLGRRGVAPIQQQALRREVVERRRWVARVAVGAEGGGSQCINYGDQYVRRHAGEYSRDRSAANSPSTSGRSPIAPEELREHPGVPEVSHGEAARFRTKAMEPFQAQAAHPYRRPVTVTGEEIDGGSGANHNFGTQPAAIAVDPDFLLRRTQSDDHEVGRGRGHGS